MRALSPIVFPKVYVCDLWIMGDSLVPSEGKVVANNATSLGKNNPLHQISSLIYLRVVVEVGVGVGK